MPAARKLLACLNWTKHIKPQVDLVSVPAWSIVLVRLAVGRIFATQGFLKYADPNMGVNRFVRIGFPAPLFTAHFVGAFEMVCEFLVLLGMWTRISAIRLLIVISMAIATTKLPELYRPNQGFWYMVSEARTDFSMLCCLLFLIISGPGVWSVDNFWSRRNVDQ
jgi:uncharacterized membrane protein YphA (DoxX/SURF4 family)